MKTTQKQRFIKKIEDYNTNVRYFFKILTIFLYFFLPEITQINYINYQLKQYRKHKC